MRRWLVVGISLGLAAVLALAVLPWWLGPVLRAVLAPRGVVFQDYQRLGYERFVLTGVVLAQPEVRVEVARLELDTPLLLLARHWRHTEGNVAIGPWRVDALEAARPPPDPARPHGAAATQALLGRLAAQLAGWIPRASLAAGQVTWPGDELALGASTLAPLRLEVRPVQYQGVAADAVFTFDADGRIHGDLRARGPVPWSARVQWWQRDMDGEFFCWDQRAAGAVRWIENGWKFSTAEFHAHDWHVPAEVLRMAAAYRQVGATVDAEWRAGRYTANAAAWAEPPPRGQTPPLLARLRATGDFHSVRVEELAVHVPGLEAELTSPWELAAHRPAPPAPSELRFAVDLAQQPYFAASGRIEGAATLTPAGLGWPRVDVRFTARDVRRGELALAAAQGRARLQWPEVRWDEVALDFAEGGALQASGRWDLAAHTLADGRLGGTVRPGLVAPWLPAGWTFERVEVAATAAGTWPGLHHAGQLTAAQVVPPGLPPLAVAAAWEGTGADVAIPRFELTAGGSRLAAAAQVAGDTVRVERLEWSGPGTPPLVLAAPVAVHWRAPVSVGPLELRGGDTAIACDYRAGAAGQADVVVDNFSPAWLRDFYPRAGAAWKVGHLELHGRWQGGPWEFTALGQLGLALADQRAAGISLRLHGNADGLAIDQLHVADGEIPVVDVAGRLPLTVASFPAWQVAFPADHPLELRAQTTANARFWARVKELTGVDLDAPDITAEIQGTWREPTGVVRARAARLALPRADGKFPLPAITELDAELRATRRELSIAKLAARLDGQAVTLSGRLPLAADQWAAWRGPPWKLLQAAGEARLVIPDADVAALARYLPGVLAPSGKLHADLEVRAGGQAGGVLQFSGVALRLPGAFGIFQDVQLEARFDGHNARIVQASARTGGQELKLTGEVGLPFDQPLRLNLALDGTNVPVVRQTGLLLRADVGLRLATNAQHVPEISGTVALRDSIFLSDIRAFLPSGGAGGPRRRPPYFAVESPFLSGWRLAVTVEGEHFLRMRSTLFVGLASLRFALDGTLGEPHATGELVVDEGEVLLPFATFQMQRASVRLTDADPFNLAVSATGTSRRYGYDLRLDVDGTAAKPRVVFTSSPTLDAKQVLLMVTAGEVPNDTITYGATQRVTRLGTYLGQSLLSSFGGDAAKADRLTITTGESVSLRGRETYDIEYRLNKRYTVVGQYDEFDDYNVGVKYRLGKIEPDRPPRIPPPPPSGPPADAPHP